ncbi:MarR family winged helix-turn-helix transcriptional regulator [Streptomyces sp. SCA3-4]|uniref:MarR family winged helix-turn-helix transcriptional regulator n=1 Tax=Streptomyces sichuanensis TaxID=2871810 RepID=UPI001CE2D1EF|nr:MarR family winged helix-turn-helix transcriptional regulator [Streptomyces sichuanensis]MCA6094273.1 MarR family winged helix-turn-helix transcriptional regulator [Streptomyces sichuanensis]
MTTTQTTKLETPNADTANLAGQPIGYWSWAANKAVIRHIRSAMARVGITQPQWWVLNRVDAAPDGKSRQELRDLLAASLDEGNDGIDIALDTAVARGWVRSTDEGRFLLTDAGREAKERTMEVVVRVREEIHAGIPDEEYATVVRVLQRMVENTGGVESLSR